MARLTRPAATSNVVQIEESLGVYQEMQV